MRLGNWGFKRMIISWKQGVGGFFLLLTVGCSGPQIPEAGSPAAERFLANCTVCHSWPHPKRHSAREWDHYLKLMDKNMQERGMELSAEDRRVIREYLHRNSR